MAGVFDNIIIPPCRTHKIKVLGYAESDYDAMRRVNRGERQIRCRKCGYWLWPDEYNPLLGKSKPKSKRKKRV